MKHKSTREIFQYWDTVRGSRRAADRRDIRPEAIRHALADSFMIDQDGRERRRLFALAGTRVCALFGRELRDNDFERLWAEDSLDEIRTLIGIVADEAQPLVAGVSARNAEGASADLELLLLPLAYEGRSHARILGGLAAISPPYWIGVEPVAHLSLGAIRFIDHGRDGEKALAPAAVKSQMQARPNFVVHAGGRA